MSGYIETGYIAAVGSLSLYGVTLLRREQLSRRRLSRLGIVVGMRKGHDESNVDKDKPLSELPDEAVTP